MSSAPKPENMSGRFILAFSTGVAIGLHSWSLVNFDLGVMDFGLLVFVFISLVGSIVGWFLASVKSLKKFRTLNLRLFSVIVFLIWTIPVPAIRGVELWLHPFPPMLADYISDHEITSSVYWGPESTRVSRYQRYETSSPIEEELKALKTLVLEDGWIFIRKQRIPGGGWTGPSGYPNYYGYLSIHKKDSGFPYYREQTLWLDCGDPSEENVPRQCEIKHTIPATPAIVVTWVLTLVFLLLIGLGVWQKRRYKTRS